MEGNQFVHCPCQWFLRIVWWAFGGKKAARSFHPLTIWVPSGPKVIWTHFLSMVCLTRYENHLSVPQDYHQHSRAQRHHCLLFHEKKKWLSSQGKINKIPSLQKSMGIPKRKGAKLLAYAPLYFSKYFIVIQCRLGLCYQYSSSCVIFVTRRNLKVYIAFTTWQVMEWIEMKGREFSSVTYCNKEQSNVAHQQ